MLRLMTFMLVVSLAGCSESAVANGRSLSNPPVGIPGLSIDGTMSRHSGPSDQWLWATGQLNNAVFAYDLGQPGYPQVATISDGINLPTELAVDANGTLYVVNNGNGDVTEYPPGSTSPSVTLGGLSYPLGVAVAANGDVYVSNVGSPSSIVVFRAGSTTPSRYIVHPLIQVPVQMFFDPFGTLYVIDNTTGIYTLRHGASRPTLLRLKKLGEQPNAIAQDPSDGSLLEGDAAPPDNTDRAKLYLLGRLKPEYQLFEQSSVHAVTFGVLGGRTVAIVPAYGPGQSIYLFHEHARKPFASIQNDIQGINGVAIQPVAGAFNAPRTR